MSEDAGDSVENTHAEICRTTVFRFEPIDWIDLLFICISLAPDVMGDAMLDREGSGLDRHQAATLGCRIEQSLESGTLNVHLKRRDGWLDLYGCLDVPWGEEGFYDLSGEPLPGYTPVHDETVVLKQELEDLAMFLKCSEGFCVSTHHFSLVARSSDLGGMAQDSR